MINAPGRPSVGLAKWLLPLLLAASLVSAPALRAQPTEGVTADEVKAAFLYRFVGYAEWPARAKPATTIVIGVLGAAAVQLALQRIAVSGKDRTPPISVRQVLSSDDMGGVHALFIGAKENARLSKLVTLAQQSPVLIVTEAPDGLDRGGMINFVTGTRVQFEVSVGNATRAGIRLNARLLSVALRVRKGARPADTVLAGSVRRLFNTIHGALIAASRVSSDPTRLLRPNS